MRVLHIIPQSVLLKENKYLGSTKDIRGRTQYFADRNIVADELCLAERSDSLALEKMRQIDLHRYDSMLFEYPMYPQTIRWIKTQRPQLNIIVRSHNAEGLQRWHYALAYAYQWRYLKDWKAVPFFLRESLRRTWMDRLCSAAADYVLSITEWEITHYWRYLTAPEKVVTVPYFLPDTYVSKKKQAGKKEKLCLCLGSTTTGTLPFNLDAAVSFTRLVEALPAGYTDWKFVLTGRIRPPFPLPERVMFVGLVDDPLLLLQKARLLVQMSEYGFGFKTKLLDAVTQQCRIAVSSDIHRRLPDELLPYSTQVTARETSSFADALNQSLLPFPDGDLNDRLRQSAYRELDKVLL